MMAKQGSYYATGAMDGIPPAVDSDAEDVAWALRTAATLWKRHEHADAIVWLRRAAQAAGETSDDDRALALARAAADLAEDSDRRPVSTVQSIAPPAGPPSWSPMHAAVEVPVHDAFDLEETPTVPASGRVVAVVEPTQLDPWAETALAEPILRETRRSEAPAPAGRFDTDEVVTSAPPLIALQSEARVAAALRVTLPDMEIDLDGTPEFSDLPDDARIAFGRCALVRILSKGEELSGFAVALVVSGAIDVASFADVPVTRLHAGSVLRSRGTVSAPVPMRLSCAADRAVIATWLESAVDDAFRTCPWVEDELRASTDRVHALVGAALGPLGESLEAAVRGEITKRMAVRSLVPGEIVGDEGALAPGLVVLGLGQLEIVRDGAVQRSLHSGDLVFANESLADEACPYTVRAGVDGAVTLFADRPLARAMVSRWPALVDLFAQA